VEGSTPTDQKKWLFTLRPGVKFHDGSAFTADAVVWNLDKVLNDKAEQYDKRQSAQVRPRLPSVASYRKVDDNDGRDHDQVHRLAVPLSDAVVHGLEPGAVRESRQGLGQVASAASGTGPFKLDKLVPRERLELVKNTDYWDKTRLAKTDRMILIPIPEALARTNALLSGQVDLIETPAPDAVPQLKGAGMKIVSNVTPQCVELSPVGLSRLALGRRAAAQGAQSRYRPGRVVALMNGLAKPAVGQVDPSSPWFGKPSFQIKQMSRRPRSWSKRPAIPRPSRSKPLSLSPKAAPGRCCRCR